MLARLTLRMETTSRVEELGDGVLVTEVGHMSNTRHLAVEQTTALGAFKALAPATPAPAALLRAHERMYPAGATILKELPAEGLALPAGAAGEQYDEDLQHSGQFELPGGAYPFSSFSSQLCNFSSASPNYIHGDHTSSRVHSTPKVHTAYGRRAATSRRWTPGLRRRQLRQFGLHSTRLATKRFYDAGQKCTTNRCECGTSSARRSARSRSARLASQVRSKAHGNFEPGALPRLRQVHALSH